MTETLARPYYQPYSVERIVAHARPVKPTGTCQGENWTAYSSSHRGHDCQRRTRWMCGRCGEYVCATHAHQHKKAADAPIGRTECARLKPLELDQRWVPRETGDPQAAVIVMELLYRVQDGEQSAVHYTVAAVHSSRYSMSVSDFRDLYELERA